MPEQSDNQTWFDKWVRTKAQTLIIAGGALSAVGITGSNLAGLWQFPAFAMQSDLVTLQAEIEQHIDARATEIAQAIVDEREDLREERARLRRSLETAQTVLGKMEEDDEDRDAQHQLILDLEAQLAALDD